METERVDRAPQPPQTSTGKHRRTIGFERALQKGQIAPKCSRPIVSGRIRRPAEQVGMAEMAAGRGKARIKAGDRAAIGFVMAMRGIVGRFLRQRRHLVRDADQACVERQLGAERVQLFEIECHHAFALATQRPAQRLRGHERIAIAIAADPTPHAKEGRQFDILPGRIGRAESILDLPVETRQLAQEGIVVIGQAVRDLVDDLEPCVPHDARLPERQNGTTQPLLAFHLLLGRQPRAVAKSQKLGDLALAIESALAPHFRRVRGQNRTDECLGEEGVEVAAGQAGLADFAQRRGHGAIARSRSRNGVGARAAYVMLILGDIGQMREIAEGADDLDGRQARQAGQYRIQLGARGLVLVPVEADRGLADAFDKLENRLTLLRPHRVAEQTPQQANVIPERKVFIAALIPDRGAGRQSPFYRRIWLTGLSFRSLRALFEPGNIGRRIRRRT